MKTFDITGGGVELRLPAKSLKEVIQSVMNLLGGVQYTIGDDRVVYILTEEDMWLPIEISEVR